MITLLVCGYAYIVWLLTGINPLPHVTFNLWLMVTLEGMIEGVFIFLAVEIIKFLRSKRNVFNNRI